MLTESGSVRLIRIPLLGVLFIGGVALIGIGALYLSWMTPAPLEDWLWRSQEWFFPVPCRPQPDSSCHPVFGLYPFVVPWLIAAGGYGWFFRRRTLGPTLLGALAITAAVMVLMRMTVTIAGWGLFVDGP